MAKETGGPAFPELSESYVDRDDNTHYNVSSSVTVRDYFAAHAPFTQDDVIHFAEAAGEQINGFQLVQMMSHMRYQYADAMLAERSKP